MSHEQAFSPDSQVLRRCLRDLVAVTALSSVWAGATHQEIAQGLADAIAKLVGADFVGVRLHEALGRNRIEARCFGEGVGAQDAQRAIDAAIDAWIDHGAPGDPFVMDNPCPGGLVRAVVLPIGLGGEFGVLAVASSRSRFPTEEERLLVVAAANQAAMVLQYQRGDEAQALLSSIVESSEDAIVSKTLDGIITSWNAGAQRLFGYPASEAIGRSIALIVPPERLDEERGILARLCRGERIEHYETVRLTRDGRRVDVSLSISPIRGRGGRIIGAAKVARDITAQKEAARRKDVFLAMLAHELRNPLAPIRNAVQLLRAKGPAEPELKWARDLIERQATHLTRLVEDLLDISRMTRGTIGLRKERVELADIVQNAVDAARPLIDEARHQLTVDLPPQPVWLDADPIRLAQALLNLLTNAAKYTDPGGEIRMGVHLAGDAVEIRVQDNGVGIASDMLEAIFEVFTQATPSLGRSQGGLGVGLPLVRQVVRMHGGTVVARSDGPGKGSEFVVRLPLPVEGAAAAEPAAAAGGSQRASAATDKCRVLIVDDNADAAESLAMLLRMRGNQVHQARDGPQAVALATTLKPDVVVLDIGLPTFDGFEAARRIRELPGGADMLLIALTGWGEEADRRKSRDAGFDHHLTKPVDLDVLSELLTRVETPATD